MNAGTLHRTIPEDERGNVRIVHDAPSPLTRMRAARDGQPLNAEKYTRLLIDGKTWMTDAEFECWTNAPIVSRAFGDVLIAGLGLGLILPTLIQDRGIESVTVLERSQDVIDLVSPHYQNSKVTVIAADCFTWEPPKKAFNCIYLDIWTDVPNEDNLSEIQALKKKYRPALRKNGWIKAWCENYARRRRY